MKLLAIPATLVAVLLPLLDSMRLHPYQVAYYNALVGGTAGAADGYWTEYPLSSYREGIEWLNARAAERPDERLTVVVAARPAVLWWAEEYTAANVDLVGYFTWQRPETLEPADYYLGSTRGDTHRHFPDNPVVHRVERAGALFAVIKGAK